MKYFTLRHVIHALAWVVAVGGTLLVIQPAHAQVAGSTTYGVTVSGTNSVALGWSAKRSILGKTVYNGNGQKIGKVQDLIIDPGNNLSYLIIGAGGFIGMGRHDVAIPIAQVQEKSGKLVMSGASKDIVQSLPVFAYANDGTQRDRLVAMAQDDIAQAHAKLAELQTKSVASSEEAQTKLRQEVAALEQDVTATERLVGEISRAAASRWREFVADLSAVTTRLRKSTQAASS
jgi:sporulation protein YlmC with PRC-barrel domain